MVDNEKVIARCPECGLRYRGSTVGNVSKEKKERHDSGYAHLRKIGKIKVY